MMIMSSMLACLMCRRMGLPTEGLPTNDELRFQEDSALQQALAESAAAAGPVFARAPAGPSSGPESVPEAALEPEVAPVVSDEPASGEAGVLAAPAPAAAPIGAEAVPSQLGAAEPAKRAKVSGCGSTCAPCMAFCGRELCCSACSRGSTLGLFKSEHFEP